MTNAERASARVEQLTVAEKVGQLVQYFYLQLPGSADLEAGQPQRVEAALERGGAGALLFVSDPATANRLLRLTIDGNRLASRPCSGST